MLLVVYPNLLTVVTPTLVLHPMSRKSYPAHLFTNGKGTWSTLYLFLGIHLPYFGSIVEDLFRLLLVFSDLLKSLWNFWIVSRPSSAHTFFLLVLLLSTMRWRLLNLWNQLLLPLNFSTSSGPQHAAIFSSFS